MRRHIRIILIPLAMAATLALSACEADRAAPVHHMGARTDAAAGAGAVMVREGETLWSISERYRLAMRDIIDLNRLSPPYHLADGQRLRLPPPMEYKVGIHDTLTGVASMHGVSASQLAQLNNIKAPYHLRAGQNLRIPSTVRRVQEKQTTMAKAATETVPPMPAPRISASAPTVVVTQETLTPVPRVSAPGTTGTNQPKQLSAPAQRETLVTTVSKPSRQGFVWPVRGKVISSFGPKAGHLHNDGINIAAPRGTAVAAAASGTVAYVGDALAGYGNLVLIRHDNGMVTAYAHLDRVAVSKDQKVMQGQAIGTVGSTGTVANAQLHFEVRRGIETLDPVKYLG
jgi:murein DD-endopeptidase MepM/ murein hydrolase activator NlpD